MLTTSNRSCSFFHIACSEIETAECMARNLHRAPTERQTRARIATINAAMDMADAAVRQLAGSPEMALDAARLSARVAALEVALAGAGAGARRAAAKSAANLFASL